MAGFFRNGTFYGGSIPNGGSTGQALLKRSNTNGDVAWGDVSGITFTYIVGSTPFAADWLSLTPSGSALTPDAKFVYLILTEGDYYHNFVRWDATNNTYLQISSGGTSTGGGAIFCTIDDTKTAFDDDWLKDANNETIEPEAGLLYLVVTSGEFENAIFKFNETSEKYENVYQDLHFNTMPSPSAYYDGKVVQFTGTTSGSFIHGYFYECVNNSGTRSWVNAKVQDGEKIQATVMPAASADLVGTVYQFIGTTDATYIHNYFYECVNQSGTYVWQDVTVERPEIQVMDLDDFDQLPQAQKDNGQVYFIPDANLTTAYRAQTGFTPIGTIISVMGTTAPNHYLACDGTVYQIASYPELANYFKGQFGSENYFGGNGTTTFAVPDLRGEFLRGTGTNSHTNQGNGDNVGTHQDATEITHINIFNDSNKGYTQIFSDNTSTTVTYSPENVDTKKYTGTRASNSAVPSWTGNAGGEGDYGVYTSRPTNTSVLYCIATKNIYIDVKNQYSMDEMVIGTWIDGKPIYQKTMLIGTTSSSQSIPVENLEMLIGYFGYCEDKNTAGIKWFIPRAMSNNYYIAVENYTDSAILLKNDLASRAENMILTIQYTKTTD